jgi:hypothetical protein
MANEKLKRGDWGIIAAIAVLSVLMAVLVAIWMPPRDQQITGGALNSIPSAALAGVLPVAHGGVGTSDESALCFAYGRLLGLYAAIEGRGYALSDKEEAMKAKATAYATDRCGKDAYDAM